MKVYIVTQGSYSDYQIVGAFSSMEIALDFKAKTKDKDPWNDYNEWVEEYEVDSWQPDKTENGMSGWSVAIREDGTVMDVSPANMANSLTVKTKHFIKFYVWAKDENHAIKIANERRIAHILAKDLQQ